MLSSTILCFFALPLFATTFSVKLASRMLITVAKMDEPRVSLLSNALASGAEINYASPEDEGMTALMCMVEAPGADAAIEFLLSQPGCDVNAKDNMGYTALHFACGSSGLLSSVRRLLAKDNCLVNEPETQQGNTPLHLAATNGNFDIVVELLNHPSIVPSIKNRIGNTALHAAVYSKNIRVVHFLLTRGFNPFEVNSSNRDVLQLCISNDLEEMLKMILNYVNPTRMSIITALAQSYAHAISLGKTKMAALIKDYMNFSCDVIIRSTQ